MTPFRIVVVAGLALAMALLLGAALLTDGARLHCQEIADYFPHRSNAQGSSTPGAALDLWLDADGEEAPSGDWNRETVERDVVRFHNGPWEVDVMRVPARGFQVASTSCTGFFP